MSSSDGGFDEKVASECKSPAGHGLWLDKQQDLCLILWKSLDAWAQTLRQWARSVGMQDSVTTLDDLSTGAEVVGTGVDPFEPIIAT